MSQGRWKQDLGFLLYSGQEGTMAGQVCQLHLSMNVDTIDVSSISSIDRFRIAGSSQVTVTAEMVGETLTRNTAHTPPDLKALLALARRHPDEYAELCEGETIMKALGG